MHYPDNTNAHSSGPSRHMAVAVVADATQAEPVSMKRMFLAGFLVLSLIALALPAEARHRDWNDHYRNHDRGWDRGWDQGRHNRWNHHPQQNYGYYYNDGWSRHHYDRGHRRNRNNEGLYLLGGVLVGSLVTHAIHESRRSWQPVYRETVYESGPVIRSTRVIRSDVTRGAEGRRLFRDRNGDCFERTTSAYGEEVLVEIDRESCAW